MTDARDKKHEPFLNRPLSKQSTPGSNIPNPPETKRPSAPLDPVDQDGVQGSEGGGGYPGPVEHPKKKS